MIRQRSATCCGVPWADSHCSNCAPSLWLSVIAKLALRMSKASCCNPPYVKLFKRHYTSYYLRSSAYRGRARRIWRWPFRDPLAASLALCLGLLLALTFALLWQWSETERTDAQQRRQQQVLQQNLHRFRRWEARIWRLVKRPADGRVQSATFSPDGKMITINGRVWVLTIPAAPTPAVEGTNTTVDHH